MGVVREDIKRAIREALLEIGFSEVEPLVEHPEDLQNGDYSTNIAMTLFAKYQALSIASSPKRLWHAGEKYQTNYKFKTPLELAREILKILKTSYPISNTCSRIEVAPPGFINFWLSESTLVGELESSLLKAGSSYGATDLGKGRRIIVEYSSPNIAKRFGIGHLRSTIIGQSIYNLYQFLGYEVIGDNHLGDWGTQFGMIIYQIINSGVSLSGLSVDRLEEFYVDFNREAKEKPELWEEAKKWFKKLEEGNNEAKRIWEACVQVSLQEFDRVYELLGVTIDNAYGESFYQDKMEEVVREAKDKDLALESEGALVVKYNSMVPGILLKSDGATTYFTRDLATIKFRLEKWNPNLVIYEVGVEQSLHFEQVFEASRMLGWADKSRFIHVKHGLYLSPDGKKFSTRQGKTVELTEVLSEAVERAKAILKDRPVKEGLVGEREGLSENQVDELARAVGVGAVKYFDLSHHPATNIVFSWDKIFLLSGNSGPYLQYTHARTRSVLRKSQFPSTKSQTISNFKFQISKPFEPEELSLLRTFYRFPEVVEEAAENYSPNLLCNFLYDLASKYNLLYNNLPILGDSRGRESSGKVREFRLALTKVTTDILKNGLGLLGIDVPERM